MLKAIKKIFGIKEPWVWIHDASKLDELPPMTVIVDNGGNTGGWPVTEWYKKFDGKWNAGQEDVNSSHFVMPFAIVSGGNRQEFF